MRLPSERTLRESLFAPPQASALAVRPEAHHLRSVEGRDGLQSRLVEGRAFGCQKAIQRQGEGRKLPPPTDVGTLGTLGEEVGRGGIKRRPDEVLDVFERRVLPEESNDS